ncbi:MAG: tetratricopeptide repeat protein [Coriobacteriia bacterium]|nr:tetratricopeptide repeat protein [Coriobacteriia bacterium]MBN2840354.1 tetratricopeptide repeat protein [Coriobacteriia bacterium]
MLNEGFAKDLDVEEFRRFRDLIHRHSGIYLEESKLDSLRISLVTRATRLGYYTFGEYLDALGRDEREFNELLNLVTINETSFFRFPGQFDALRDEVLPEIMGSRPVGKRDLRIWSAGCSTGEEPYSLSMLTLDMGLGASGWSPQILGTDVSTKALGRARAGVYGRRAMMNVPPDVVQRHFDLTPTGDYRVNDRVRAQVDFGYQNLIKEPYPLSLMGNWDVIFCRNVTIYFRIESTRRVVRNFYDSLNDGGYLFIGHSETLTSISDDFEPVEIGGVFLYRKPPAKPLFTRGRPARLTGESRPKVSGPAGLTASRSVRTPPEAKVPAPRQRRQTPPAEPPVAPVASPAVADTEESIEASLQRARTDMKEGRPAQVIVAADRVLERDPNNADAHLLVAYVHADTGDYDEALAACHRALAINPLLPVARYILGIIHQRQGDAVRAISELKKTIYIDADFALAHLNLANIYKAQRQFDLAAKEYENALRALKKSPDGDWTEFSGGFQADLLARTCERSLIECRKTAGKG